MADSSARAPLTMVIAMAVILSAAPGRLVRAEAGPKRGDDSPAPQATTPTTTKGRVYSAPQATRGELTYMSACVSCHPPATYKGAVFLNWQGRTLAELLEFLSEKMPKNDPGSLSPKEYAQVMAYLLKLNGMPAGRTELPTDRAALRGITINLLPSGLQPSHHP